MSQEGGVSRRLQACSGVDDIPVRETEPTPHPLASASDRPLKGGGSKRRNSYVGCVYQLLQSASVRSRPFFTIAMNSSIWALVQVRHGEISMVSRVARSIRPLRMQ